MPIASETRKLFSFDGTQSLETQVVDSDGYESLFSEFDKLNKISICGAGLSPALATGTDQGLSFFTDKFDRVLDFNREQGWVTAESGISLGKLLQFLLKHNCWLETLPGHPNIRLGGCIGFNVHGKGGGVFGDQVLSLKVYHPQYGEQICSREENPQLFDLTLGGMGATGWVTEVQLKVNQLVGQRIRRKKMRSKNLTHSLQLIRENQLPGAHIYSWNNLTQTNRDQFGEGFVYIDEVVDGFLKTNSHFLPMNAANRNSFIFSRLFPVIKNKMSRVYKLMESFKRDELYLDLFSGSFPIRGKEYYYGMFGERGFREFQVLLPFSSWTGFSQSLFKSVQKWRPTVTLGSLKTLNGKRKYLNFNGEGVVLAINGPATQNTMNFFDELDSLVIDRGGIHNLCKDSRLSSQVVHKTYQGQWESFKEQIEKYDSKRIFINPILEKIWEDR